MIRTKGEPGTGDIVQAVRHMRKMNSEIQKLTSMREDELFEAAKSCRFRTILFSMFMITAVSRLSTLQPAVWQLLPMQR